MQTVRCSSCGKLKSRADYSRYEMWSQGKRTGRWTYYLQCRKCRYAVRAARRKLERSGKRLENTRILLLMYASELHGRLNNLDRAHPHLFHQLMRRLQWANGNGKRGLNRPDPEASDACGAESVSALLIGGFLGSAIDASASDACRRVDG